MKITLQRSRLLMVYLLLMHVSALLLISQIGLSLMFEAFVSLLIIGSLVCYSRCYGWMAQRPQVESLWVDDDGFWFMTDQEGRVQGPMRLKSSVIMGPLIAIYFRPLNGFIAKSVLIPFDAVDADNWRRLRVRLRDPASWD